MIKELERKIREKLPRLLEPTTGCRVRFSKDGNIHNGIITFANLTENDYLIQIQGILSDGLYYEGLLGDLYPDEKANGDFFEIIGHDISLSDLIDFDKRLQFSKLFDYTEDSIPCEGLWNFSNTCLKDQSGEVDEYLYERYFK